MNEVKELVEELRNKKSRDNRELLDKSADMIERLAKELCEKSSCHHKCHDTDKCVVEEEAELLINGNKTIPKIRPNPNWRENKNRCCCFCGETRSVKYLVDLPNIYGERALTVDACNRCALLLINENKSNNFDVKSNKQIEEMAVEFAKINCNPKGCYGCDLCDEYCSLELSCEDYLYCRKIAEHLYNAGYRKQKQEEKTYD